MISFKQYILEKWEAFPRHDDNGYSFRNNQSVHGTEVNIDFHHLGDGHYDLAFSTNGEMGRDPKQDPMKGKKTYLHVHSKINQFIRAVRPHSINFSAYNDETDHMYQKMGHRIAKRHGAKFLPDPEAGHMILFDRKK